MAGVWPNLAPFCCLNTLCEQITSVLFSNTQVSLPVLEEEKPCTKRPFDGSKENGPP